MSLWKNSIGPKDAPVWYARHGAFDGLNVSENKVTKLSGTNFKNGDAVIYLADTPLSGLSNKSVYYVRNAGGVNLYDTRAHALALASEDGKISFSASAATSKHLFIKYDRKETTNDGKEQPALIAVSKETAAQRVGGLVSPGWYRYFKYKGNDNRDRVHLELLAGVKTMVTEGTYSITGKFVSTTAGDDKWDKSNSSSVNKLVVSITTTGPLHKTIDVILEPRAGTGETEEYPGYFWGHAQAGFTFSYSGEGGVTSLPNEGQASANPHTMYIKVPVNVESAQTVTAEVIMTGGNLSRVSPNTNKKLICYMGTPADINNVTSEELHQYSFGGDFGAPLPYYNLTFAGVHKSTAEPVTYEDGWWDQSANFLKIELTPTEAFTGNVSFNVTLKDHDSQTNLYLYDPRFNFVDDETGDPVEWIGTRQLTKTINFTGSTSTVSMLWRMEDGNFQDLGSGGVDIIINAYSDVAGSKAVSGLITVSHT